MGAGASTKYTLYNTGASPFGLPVVGLLAQLGVKHDYRDLDFSKQEQKKAPLIDINPLGQVPTLGLGNGTGIGEGSAIT